MKKFISFLFFAPLFLYLFIAILNPTVLFQTSDINIFWFFSVKWVPVLAYTILFFSIYIVIIWILLKFSDIFSNIQKSKLENEVNRLKANLQDGQWSILTEIKKEFALLIEKQWTENTQILQKLTWEMATLKEKIDTLKK